MHSDRTSGAEAPESTSFARAKRLCGMLLLAIVLSSTVLADGPPAEPAVTRQDLIAAQQIEKAQRNEEPRPERAEAIVRRVEGLFLVDTAGVFPCFDSVYHGGGLTVGAGYRQFYGDNSFWQVKGLYSVLNYKLIEGGTVSRDHLNRKLTFGTRLGWRDATQVAFYGIGGDTKKEDRANFRFQQTYLEGNAVLRPRRWLPIQTRVALEHWNTLQGQGSDPSIETRYTSQTAPGLGASPTYIHSTFSAGIDWRQSPGYSRRGGLYALTFHDFRNINGGIYSFQKLDGQLIQYVPLLRDTWVLAARGKVETTLNNNDLVPYFMLPALGSGSTLRAYSSDRFRDRHSMIMTAEFRWIPTAGLDMALFYDAGKVTSRRTDLDFTNLKSDVGIGARFHGPMATPLRIDLAVGNEGWRLVLSAGPVF